jgi:hypothetical protein
MCSGLTSVLHLAVITKTKTTADDENESRTPRILLFKQEKRVSYGYKKCSDYAIETKRADRKKRKSKTGVLIILHNFLSVAMRKPWADREGIKIVYVIRSTLRYHNNHITPCEKEKKKG